jgi:hypothetical protein
VRPCAVRLRRSTSPRRRRIKTMDASFRVTTGVRPTPGPWLWAE